MRSVIRPPVWLPRIVRELAKFGTVGGVAYVVQLASTNAFWLLLDAPPLAGQALGVLIATVVAFLGNRFWTFGHRARTGLAREYALFFVFNAVGLGIQLACLAISVYGLGLDGPLAQNIAGNVVGVGMGSLFRFWTYRRWVFPAHAESGPQPAGNADAESPGTAASAREVEPS
ncbi:GtrA family protein [Streptomonospora wellingtoniae]|uniref:GtrA family protein n=1 Tax=Streptomonospora wellingtoniae TaxID=3075544 RepID=A0ABU2KZJ9_9ACTN|nr:GtrA family protein [Streptomonospora sp. DSM 45055]MDT0304582.1 GtrA family protein [Streptomonospora sp. DSM 45055]